MLTADSGSISQSECGIVEVPLIIGGQKASPKEFPHFAEIGFGAPLKFYCGGSIISERAILSAAHCLDHDEDGPAKVARVGALNHDDLSNAATINIAQRIAHPQYHTAAKYHDICIFKLAEDIQFSPFVRPACINVEMNLQWNTAIVIGFGRTEQDSDKTSDHLLKVQLQKFTTEECQGVYGENPEMKEGLKESQFCAGEKVDHKDSCQGDSGGPIQVVLGDPYCMYNIIGVVSFGKLCGFANSPGVYTNVASYIDWIEQLAWT